MSSFQYSVCWEKKGVRKETTQKVDIVSPACESNMCEAKVNDHHKVKTLDYTVSCFTKSNYKSLIMWKQPLSSSQMETLPHN